jgi:hypothetical protein
MTNVFRKKIDTGTGTPVLTTVVSTSCAVKQIVISVFSAGTGWVLRIQDIAAIPFVLVPPTTLTAPSTPSAAIINFDEPVYMEGGVNVVTSGTTAGVVYVWVNGSTGS